MERKFLEEIGLEKEAIDKIMAENGADINKAKKDVDAIIAERDGLKTQLGDANKVVEGMKALDPDALKKAADDWKAKYDGEVAARKEDAENRAYSSVLAAKAAGEKFSSEAAKKAFISDLKEKGLKVDGDTLLGYDDFKKTYAEADPGAFVTETGKPTPKIVQPSTPPAAGSTWRDNIAKNYAAAKQSEKGD